MTTTDIRAQVLMATIDAVTDAEKQLCEMFLGMTDKKSGYCETCGDEISSANIEAFEISGKLLCDDCAEEVFEDNSQFGVGA